MNRPIIRVASLKDCARLANFAALTFRESWLEEGNEIDLTMHIAEHFSIERLSSDLSGSKCSYHVIVHKKEFIAYCKIESNINPENFILEKPLCICRLYVKKEFQNLSYGSKLIDVVIKIAKNENYNMIWLGVWNENKNAIRLYEKKGFIKFGTHKFAMGNLIFDDDLYKKELLKI